MALRFKLDENVPSETAAFLRDAGHDVRSALEQALGGSSDEKVLTACRSEARILVTLDLDFGDIRTYPPASPPVATSNSSTCGRVKLLHPGWRDEGDFSGV